MTPIARHLRAASARATALLLLLLASLAACNHPAQGGVDGNQSLWAAKRPARYRYTFQWSCFCAPEYTAKVRITVEGSTVKEVVDASTGTAVANPGDFTTIDGLFAELQEAIGRNADTITATYDATWGYPRSVSIDYIKNAADDEKAFTVSSFEPLP